MHLFLNFAAPNNPGLPAKSGTDEAGNHVPRFDLASLETWLKR